ncbi:MAG TPA: hypothetical protein PKK33_06305, partial [Candidatus Cloacimonadota bacterium]|nr:hypothetical protein [Candidatus Cloacimonadota bacterium]
VNVTQLPFEISTLWDLYVTQDGKLIFAADRYYITEPDTINPAPFTDNINVDLRKLTLSNNNKAYYCNNGDLFQYDFQTNSQTNLTSNFEGHLVNPNISPDNSRISFIQVNNAKYDIAKLGYYSLDGDSVHIIVNAGN